MSKFLIGAVIVMVAIAGGIGAAALAGPRLGQYLQSRISTSSRQFRAPFPYPGTRPPRNGQGAPGFHGISGQRSSLGQNSQAVLGSYPQWVGSNSKIAGLSNFNDLSGGQSVILFV
jgi:hypothetical protein